MLDVVTALSAQTAATARIEPREESAAFSQTAQQSAPKPSSHGFVNSSVRVDNLQNIAILEYRAENGEVLQQYPTQFQIDAFKRAASLQGQKDQIAALQRAPIVDGAVAASISTAFVIELKPAPEPAQASESGENASDLHVTAKSVIV